MHGETKEAKEHAHTWEIVKFNNELIGKTNTLNDHFHILAIHSTDKFAAGMTLQTSEVDGHSHEVVISENLLTKFRRLNLRTGPRDGTGPLGRTDACPVNKKGGYQDDDVYGPDGLDEEEDEKKRMKQKIDEDGEIEDRSKKFQGKFTKVKWNFSAANYSIEQLRQAVTATMRAWGDKQGGKKGDYKLPYKMPDGTINVNGVRNALARASQVKGVPSATIQKVVSELQRVLAVARKAGFVSREEDEEGKKKFEDRAAIVARLQAKYADNPNVEVQDDRVFVRNQHLFQVGTWNGIKITERKILRMAENFNKLKNSFLPAIKAGHDPDEHRKQFGEFSLGWVHNAHSALPFMDGDLEFPLDVFDKIINPGKLRFKSIETWRNLKRDGKNYDEVLFGLALLGVNPPALTDLGPVVQPFSDNTCEVVCIDFDNGGEGTMPTDDKKDEGIQKFQDEIAKLKKELADKSKVNETLTGERDTFAQAATHYSAQLRAKDAQMFADTLKAAGKLTKAQEPMFKSLFLTMDDSKKLEFCQDDGSKKDMSQVEMFHDLFESLAPQVDLKEGATEGDQNPDVPDPDASQKKSGLVEECSSNVKGAEKFSDIAKKSGWKFAGNDILDRAIALQKKSGLNEKGKYALKYEDALALVYAQKMSS